ncbi:unnamed protein product [Rotaria sp. Silwood1]|nr:unnamed protein product [Rotaria sp. Silwood1]
MKRKIALQVIQLALLKLPILLRHKRLQKDYKNISFLPLSPIPLIGNIPQFDKQHHVFFQLLCRLAKQSQDEGKGLFCIWLGITPRIFLCSGQGLESFINNSKQLVKSFHYTFLEPWLQTGLLTSNNDKWRSRRRLITPSFHDTELLHNFMSIFNEQACILVRRFDEYSKQENKTHDLYPYISACTLDIIAEAAMGTNPNAQLNNNNNNEFVEATTGITSIVATRARCPWLWPTCIFDRLPIGKKQKRLLEVLHGFSRKVIKERLVTWNSDDDDDVANKNGEKKQRRRLVFLDSLISQMHHEQLSFNDIQEEVDTFMFEGHDTTATAINYCCYLVGCHQDVQEKIHAEIDTIFGGSYLYQVYF